MTVEVGYSHIPQPLRKACALHDVRDYLGEERWKLMADVARRSDGKSVRALWETLTIYLDFAGVRGYPARVYATQMCALRIKGRL